MAWIAATEGEDALLDQQARSLDAVRTSRQHFLETYLDIVGEQILSFAQSQSVVTATEALAIDLHCASRGCRG